VRTVSAHACLVARKGDSFILPGYRSRQSSKLSYNGGMKNSKPFLIAALLLVSLQPVQAQLLVKVTPEAEKALYDLDKGSLGRTVPITVDLTPHDCINLKRIWKSGYAGASAKDRVTFCLAYDKWLRDNGEDETKLDPMLPYSMRLHWAKQWWSKYTTAFDREHATAADPDPWSEWARESIIDAAILLKMVKAPDFLNQQNGDTVQRDAVEIACVYGKKEDMIDRMPHPPKKQ
jgi:hypothetical protein